MFEVELDIFSGRPNPRWTLDGREEAELIERMSDRTVPFVAPNDTDGYLGYRGFVLRATGNTAAVLTSRGLPTEFRVRDGLGHTIDLGAESWLLATAVPQGIPGHVVKAAEDRLSTPSDALAKCKPYFTSSTDFSDWNGQWWTSQNNCYNYGSNHRTDTFAQPGRGGGDQWDSDCCGAGREAEERSAGRHKGTDLRIRGAEAGPPRHGDRVCKRFPIDVNH